MSECMMEVKTAPLAPVGKSIALACFSDPVATGNLYIEVLVHQFRGIADDQRLQNAYQTIVNRHDALRTVFNVQDSDIVATVHPSGSVPADLQVLSLEEHDIDAPQVKDALNKAAQKPFNLGQAPLARLVIIHAQANRHLLLLCYNHCVMDGGSQGIWIRELEALYNGETLPTLDHHYTDFAAWEQDLLTAQDSKLATNQLDYWRTTLSGAPETLELPGDHSRPPVCSFLGKMVTFSIPEDIRTGLSPFMARERQSLLRVMLAAYAITLNKYSQQNEVVITVPRSLRRPIVDDGIIGNFINILPIRLEVNDFTPFKDAVKITGQAVKDAVANGDVPFESIVKACCTGRNAAYSAIAQALITVHDQGWFKAPALDGLASEPCSIPVDTGRCINDITLRILPGDTSMDCQLLYNTEVFSEKNIARLVDSFLHVLRAALENPDAPSIDVLGAEHLSELQNLSMGEERPEYLEQPLVHEAFEAMAEQFPERRCLCYEGEWLSYGEVDARVDTLAGQMVEKFGVGPGVVVGLMLDRSFELVISMLAVLKAGGCFLPCDPSYPDDRLSIYLEDGKAVMVLAQAQQVDRALSMVASDVYIVNVDDVCSSTNIILGAPADSNSNGNISVEKKIKNPAKLADPAYILFTSGSTGRPKGVVINHAALIDFLAYNLEYYSVDKDSISLLSITINFDPSIMQIFTPLIVGGGLVIARPSGHMDAEYLANLLLNQSVTFFNTVPSLGLEYYRRPAAKSCVALKSAIFSGEAMPMELVHLIHRNVPKGVRVYNAYGPTEATVMATNLECPADLSYMTIGRPENNMHCYIVNAETLRLVPVGVPGELLLSGPRLALGYAHRPELTEEKFIRNPCLDLVAGTIAPSLTRYFEKAYRTGDLVRWRSDGSIDFMGRIDRQTKVNGVRIELGEVEAALENCDGVVHAVAAAVADPLGQKRLVGYITPGNIRPDAVIKNCRSVLVSAMVPSVVIALDAFPLLPNGKVDVKGLPAPDWSGAKSSEEYVGPDGEVEIAVQKVFAEVLGRPAEELSVLADFFSAGGTSLQIFRANALLQETFKMDSIAVTMVHTERSVRGVAAALGKLLAPQDGSVCASPVGAPPLKATTWPDAKRPLSFNQEQMWLVSTMGGSSAYNMPIVLETDVAPDLPALQAALDAVAGRHEVMRTRFERQADGTVAGIVVSAIDFRMPVQVIEVESHEKEVQLVSEEAATGFDLESEPLVRVLLLLRQTPRSRAVLSVTMHHAVGDAWSQGVFWKELSEAYAAALSGEECSWAPLPVQYADYAAWQRELLAGEGGTVLRAFWKQSLAGAPSMVQLPQDRPRPARPTNAAGSVRTALPAGLLPRLEGVARDLRVNVQAVLLAGLQAVLLRYSGQDDLVIGVPVAGRDRQETHGLVGYFINTLPVRCIASEDASFEDMVVNASKATLAALEHSLLPLEDVVAAAGVARVPNANPLFQVLFQYLPEDLVAGGSPVCTLGKSSLKHFGSPGGLAHAKMDLTFTMSGETVMLDYMSELFDESTIKRMFGSFVAVLEHCMTDPTVPALAINILGSSQAEVVAAFSLGEEHPEYLKRPLTHEAIEIIAGQSPERKCLCYEGEWLSYGEVDARANTLAGQLSALGVGPGVVVGLMLERSFELIICIIAIFKAGGCYLPCDPSYPDDRLSIYLEDGKALVVLVKPQHADRAKAMVPSAVSVVEIGSGAFATAPLKPPSPEDPAYIIFTSGSTGRPKGVMVPHRALRDHLEGSVEYYNMGEEDVGLLTITINFDPHLMQAFMPLIIGGGLVIATPEGHTNANYVMSLIKQQGVTQYICTPSLALMQFAGEEARECTALRCVMFGGEQLPREIISLFAEKLPWCKVYNVYGPTEATITATELYCPPSVDFISIGRPVYNLQTFIVDAAMRPVPVGVPGELLLSGPRLALCYANRPDLTAETFIQNPCLKLIAGKVGQALLPHCQKAYRTGDLVRWRNDGTIDFLGRIDRQVKITGVRIELGEVEGAMESTPGVNQAVATAAVDPSGQKRLVGYITPGDVDSAAVIAHCRSRLVPAMVPSVVLALDAFPLLPGGKIDVKALPVPDLSGSGSEEHVSPGNSTEIAVQKVFAEVLGRPAEELSVLADFFAAGGTSLQVFRANALLQQAFKLESIPATLVHNDRSVRGVAAALVGLMKSENGIASFPLIAHKWPDAMRPLSANQEQMWLLSTIGGSSAYNMPIVLETTVIPDVKTLSSALDVVAGRHEVLRTRFQRKADGTVAGSVVSSSLFHVPLQVVEVFSEEEESQQLSNEAAGEFHLEVDPLVRVKLLVRNGFDSGAVLALTMHHAVGDAWSQGVFWKELSEAYAAALSGEECSWAPLPVQYADYAAWQRELLAGEGGTVLRAFWKQSLAGAPSMVQLPQDRPRPARPTNAAGSVRTALPAGLLPRLEGVARDLRVNVQAVLLAGLQAVLLRYSGQDDLVIGVPVAGRDRQETHGLVGYFINTLPVRCIASEDASFEDMIVNASKATLAALEHSLLPLEDVVAAAGVARVPNANPLFQVLFQYLPEDPASGVGPVCVLKDSIFKQHPKPKALAHAKMDLVISLGGNSLVADYMAELFDTSTISRIISSFTSILEQLASNMKAPALAGSLLGAQEKEEMAEMSMGLQRPDFLSFPLMHEAVNKIAVESPERKCLCYEGEWLSYGEVDARANTLAGQLSALGVGPAVVVGLMLERSFELVVSILAVMKAGGCYLPCDPSYPNDRLSIYLEDGGALVVLTQAKHIERASSMVSTVNVSVYDVNKISQENDDSNSASLKNAGPEDPAYMIFTSGSTGRPKGVMLPHRGLRDLLPWLIEQFSLSSEDVVVFSNTINFDAHVIQALPVLAAGAALVIARPDGHLDPAYIVSLILKYRITGFVCTVPTLAKEYVGELQRGGHAPYAPMKAWGIGGDSAPADVVRQMQTAFPNLRGPVNMYGPTEVTAVTVQHVFEKGFTNIVIGRPDPNTHAYVVDAALRPVPVGVPGELVLSGPRLALGYAGRPDLTEEKFVPNPCFDLVAKKIVPELRSHYQKAYRTGDLVRWRSDGTLEFMGRIDRQVKVNGVRIELGEVESALESAEGVSQAVALAVMDPHGQKRLIGYVSPGNVDPTLIIAHCRSLLVPAMVPSVVLPLEAFPLMPNGKVDVRALPSHDWSGTAAGGSEEYIAPADEIETAVQRAFADVLNRPAKELSVISDFFALGGSSLQAMRLPALLHDAVGVTIAASEIISFPAARQIADILKEAMKQEFNGAVEPVMWPDNTRPTSSGQESLCLTYFLHPDDLELNEPSCIEVFGDLNVEALQKAFNQLLQRHEVLRCGFKRENGVIVSFLDPTATTVPMTILKEPIASDEEIKALLTKAMRYQFDLASPPYMRVTVSPVGPRRHIVMFVMHHIAMDGWSLAPIWIDVMAFYKAIVTGNPPQVRDLRVQYSDFAAWERKQLEPGTEKYEKMALYWKKQLQHATPVVQLPEDYARQVHPTEHLPLVDGNAVISIGQLDALKELASSLKVSLYALCLAAFRLMLCEFGATDDVLIASSFSMRPPGTENLVGYFLRMLLLRNRLEESDSFSTLVVREMSTLTAAIEHSILPLQEVLKVSNLPRAPGRTPSWQAAITWDEHEWMDPSAALGEDSPLDMAPYINFDLADAPTDVILGLEPSPEGLKLRLGCDGNLFKQETVDRMFRRLVQIFENAAAAPYQLLKSTQLLAESERDEVARFSIGPEHVEYLEVPLVHEALALIAGQSPERRCLCFEGQWLSYGEVDARANTLAGQLSALGVGPGVVVGLMLDRSFELVVSIFAVLKAGGCYLPCDPAYPDDRLSIYLEDGKAIVALTQAKHFDRAADMVGTGVKVVDVNKLSEENATAPLKPPSPEDPAYIIFTSGSTGRPKGVMVPHRGLKDLMPWLVDMYHLNHNDNIVFSNTISFDAHVLQVFPPLTVGATLVIAKPEGHFDPVYIVDLILANNITGFMFTVPTLAREYVNELKRRGQSPYVPMRSWGVGGESVPADVVRQMHTFFPNLEPINTYGPTEVTAVAVHYQFPRGFPSVVIGRPDANLIAVIVDAALRPVPIGVPGELLLSGPRLALGYVGRPDLTEEKFISNPCVDLFAGRVAPALLPYYKKAYRTGDLVRWRSDGQLEFMGRIDRQVKITGVRIELGEVEAALENTEGVAQAVAAAVADLAGQKRLVGYVTPGDISPAAVTAHCRSVLVPAMVPSVVVALEAFPLLPNGKVDVRALPAPDWSGAGGSEEYVAPATDIEKSVQRVFAEVLGRPAEQLSVLADFFAAGGTSLQVFRANAMLQDDLGAASIPSTIVHTGRSARGVASALAELMESGNAGSVAASLVDAPPLITTTWPDATRPLSANQEQMWLVSTMGGSSAYNMPTVLETNLTPDIAALSTALDAVAGRHEVLRTRFERQADGTVAGVVVSPSEFHVPVAVAQVDSHEEEVKEVAVAVAQPFNLEVDPLVRVKLLVRNGFESGAVLALTMHHAVGDAWSQGVFWKELSEAYAAALSGEECSWAPLPVQYADYAAWQRELLAGEGGTVLRAFWKQSLAGAPSMVQLPQDRPRPARPTNAAGYVRSSLPPGLSSRLESVAQALRVNLQAVLLAGLQAVLLRYSGQDDLVIGVPVAGRDRQETHGLVGYFINTLPVRCIASEDASFEDMVVNASKATLAALEHSLLPLEDVVAAAGVARVPNANPLFQVLFQYLPGNSKESSEHQKMVLGKTLVCTPYLEMPGLAHAKMDLGLYITGESIMLEYMAELFDHKTIERIGGSYIALLEHLATDSSSAAFGANIVGPEEMVLVAHTFQGQLAPEVLKAPYTLQQIEIMAQQQPNATCLIFEEEVMTYSEVNARANQLARFLVQRCPGIENGESVGLMLERSFELIISMLGVMKAGGAYVPLDPDYPSERLAMYVEDGKMVAVLVNKRSNVHRATDVISAAPTNPLVLDFESMQPDLVAESTSNLDLEIKPDQLAYMIFTSGSTGRPKGAMLNHLGMRDTVMGYNDVYDIQQSNVHLLNISISFDPHVLEVFCPLSRGATLVIPRQNGHLDPEYLASIIQRHTIDTMMLVVPSVMQMYLSSPSMRDALKVLQQIGIGGEALPTQLVNNMQHLMTRNDGVINWYGPTECTVQSTNWRCPCPCTETRIGGPDQNTYLFVVDPHTKCLLPINAPGELWISGPRVGPGYISRQDLTDKAFVENPFYTEIASNIPDVLRPYFKRCYRTGDLVRWRSDGTIDFLGRIDRQVKITGVRIELGEVEAALESTEGVAQAVAAAVADLAGQKRLVGYVTPGDISPAAVTAHCRSVLVPAMVPSVVVALEAFPLLPNGKVDVRALPAPDWSGAGGSEEYVAPATDTEIAVQKVFAEVLGRPSEELSVLVDFFAAGGTSLQVFRANALLQKAFNLGSIPATVVHTERSARGVAAALSVILGSTKHPGSVSLKAHDWPAAMRPLSFNQEQMWLLSTLGGSSAYNMPSVLETAVVPDVAALRAALDAVGARHEVLRTRFERQSDGTVAGVVWGASEFHVPIKLVEITSQEEERKEVMEEAATGFDLESEPLVRVKLLVRNGFDSGAVLALTMHHAVGDAWSQGVFWKELSEAYAAALSGEECSWAPLPVQYADYAAWQRDLLAGEGGTVLRAFWKQSLAGAPSMVQLPQDRPRPARPTNAAGSVRTALPAGLLPRLEGVARDLRVNVQAVLLAGLQAVLLRYSGQDDLVIGVPVAGRDRQETHGLVGYFINTLPVRCIASEDASFEDMALGASKSMLAALEHSLLPLEDVVAAAGVARVPNANPLFQIVLQYLPDADNQDALSLGDIELKPYNSHVGLGHAKMDLSITMSKKVVLVDYMSELFDISTIERIFGSFMAVLEQCVKDTSVPALAIDILGSSQAEVVAAFSLGEEHAEYLKRPLTHEAIEIIAGQTPERKCLCYEGEWLSYGEVDARANTLAGQLSALGVGPGVVVGLMLERSFELIISIIAIFKAGGCYLPCDPSYPDDRLSIYLEDGKALVVLVKPQHADRAKSMVLPETTVVEVDPDGSAAATATSLRSTLHRACSEDPAYIIFTSGSTGRPKGVMIPHRGLRDHLNGSIDFFGVVSTDVGMLTITINFDPHMTQAFMPLVAGASLVIATPEGHTDAEYIKRTIKNNEVTHYTSTPSLALLHFQDEHLRQWCSSLRCAMFGGEQLPREVVKLFGEKLPSCAVYNVYGPTEATITATQIHCLPSQDFITIGMPVHNMIAFIVDAALRPVPVGVPGELLLSGPQLALGYAGRPDLTEEKFVLNPCFDLVAKKVSIELVPYYEKVYRTGDLVRWRSDGTIDFMGRIDRQVKITGVRIELGEVEGAMEGTPGVNQAVATAMVDPNNGQKRLVGYVVPGSIDPAAVRSHCRSLLVPAMVPTVVTALDAFPLLPNGKVDVRALPDPDWTAQATAVATIAAARRATALNSSKNSSAAAAARIATEITDEHSLAVLEIIGDILGLEASEIPLSVELFDLGASSIQIAAIVGKIRKELGVNLDLRGIYSNPGVENLCAAVRLEKGDDDNGVENRSKKGNKVLKSNAKHRILGYPIPIWQPGFSCTRGVVGRVVNSATQLLAVMCLIVCIAASMLPGMFFFGAISKLFSTSSAIIFAPFAYFVWAVSLLLISIGAKWTLIGRYTPGTHPVWSFFFMRWWIVHRLVIFTEKITLGYLAGTSLLCKYMQAMGVAIENDGVCIHTCSITDFDLISIGKDSRIDCNVLLTGHSIERGFLVLQEVNIGSDCFVGMQSVVMPGTSLDNGVSLEGMSMVPLGVALPPNTTWQGSPARLKEKSPASVAGGANNNGSSVAANGIAPSPVEENQLLSSGAVTTANQIGLAVSIAMTWLALLPLAASVVYLWQTSFILVAASAGFGLVAANILYMAEAILLKWVVLGGRLKPGTYKTNSAYAVRFTLVQSWLTAAPLAKSFCALFAHTPLMPIVLRALGAKIGGKNNIFGLSPAMLAGADQIQLGESATLGYGAAVLGAAVVSGEELIIATTVVKESSFIADGAVVMPGCTLGKGSLVGVQSIIQSYSTLAQGSVWSGSPAFCLDPGLVEEETMFGFTAASSKGGQQRPKKQSTRWLLSQEALLQRPNSKVLTSRGLVAVHTARTFEGTSMMLKTLVEDVGYSTKEEEVESAANVREAWKASLGRNRNNNTFLRPKTTAFSQASMIIEQLKEAKETQSNYGQLSLLVPSVLLPCWIFIALLVPLYCVNNAITSSSSFIAGIFGILNAATVSLMLFGVTIASLLVLTKKYFIGKFNIASYSMDGSSSSTALLHSSNLEVLYIAASTLSLDVIMGTQGAAWCLAALGAQVGSDVYMENFPLIEADLLTLETGVTIERGSHIASYNVENGCMDYLQVRVAPQVTFGPRSYAMPGVVFERQSALGALSVAMKGENVAQGMYMEGSPLVCVGTWYQEPTDVEGPAQPHVPAEHLVVVEEMRKDAHLPEEIKLPEAIVVRTGPPQIVFLTGATGFVGAFILRELLKKHLAENNGDGGGGADIKKVYCLVRASSVEQGVDRIKHQLLHHGLCTEKQWNNSFAPRVAALPGDLGQPRLGLTEGTFQDLCDEVDVVINNGALVNLSKGYDFMRASNVGAVLELLRLCISGRALTPLHQISTIGTLPRSTDKLIKERFDSNADALYMGSGYDQTKWVSEQLISQANDRGLPVALHRLGRIGGDSKSGGANESDFCMLIVKGCLQMGCFPREYNMDLGIVPGDMAAKIVVERAVNTSRNNGGSSSNRNRRNNTVGVAGGEDEGVSSSVSSSLGCVYHVSNPHPPPFQLAITVLRGMGYCFEEVTYPAWRERLLSCASEDNALRPLEMAFGPFPIPKSATKLVIDCSNAGIADNTTTAEQLLKDFTWFKKVGFFPAEAGKSV